MNPPSMNNHPEPNEEFVAELRQFSLGPPPPAWRADILSAAVPPSRAPVVRWFRSPFWQSMAALWGVLATLWLDTQRLTPAEIASPVSSEQFSPAARQKLQALLASLGNENRQHLHSHE
jgi:hypothetical protein